MRANALWKYGISRITSTCYVYIHINVYIYMYTYICVYMRQWHADKYVMSHITST